MLHTKALKGKVLHYQAEPSPIIFSVSQCPLCVLMVLRVTDRTLWWLINGEQSVS